MLIRTQFSSIGNKHINKSVRDTAGKKVAILGDIKITWGYQNGYRKLHRRVMLTNFKGL